MWYADVDFTVLAIPLGLLTAWGAFRLKQQRKLGVHSTGLDRAIWGMLGVIAALEIFFAIFHRYH